MPVYAAADLPRCPDIKLADIEWRPEGKGNRERSVCMWVAYVDAALVARTLDDWVGPANWTADYDEDVINDRPLLWCRVSIRVLNTAGEEEWVSKADVGNVTAGIEANKAAVSDAFKRAAARQWGAGRIAWFLPRVWAPCRFRSDGKIAGPAAETPAAILAELHKRGHRDLEEVRAASAEGDADTEGHNDDADLEDRQEAARSAQDEKAPPTTAPRPGNAARGQGAGSPARSVPRRDRPSTPARPAQGPVAGEARHDTRPDGSPNMVQALLDELTGRDLLDASKLLRNESLWPVGDLDDAGMARAVEVLEPIIEEARAEKSAGATS